MGYEGNDRRPGRDRGFGGRDDWDRGYGDRGDGGYGRDELRSERGYERGGYDRDRGSERYGRSGGREPRDYDRDDRGFFDRAGDEVRSWFGDEDAERRRRADERRWREEYDRGQREYQRSYGRSGPPSDSYGGFGFEGFGVGLPPMAGPYGAVPPSPGSYRGGSAERGPVRGVRPQDQQGRGSYGHDHAYRSWRDRQMEAFDRDYDEFRREHQSKFESDFGSWRETRQGQRQHLQRAKEGQEVVGSDGAHVGEVDHVRGDRIILTKSDRDAGGHHHSIPVAWIQSVDEKVTINKSADEAHRLWRDEEQTGALFGGGSQSRPGEGEADASGNLDRSFRGTY